MAWLYLVLFAFSVIAKAESLRCYACSSSSNTGCADPFNYEKVKGDLAYCDPLRNDGQTYFCVKSVFSYSYYSTAREDRPDIYSRKCTSDLNNDMSPGTCPKFVTHDVEINLTHVTCDICNFDGCNGAGRLMKSTTFFLCYAVCLLLIRE